METGFFGLVLSVIAGFFVWIRKRFVGLLNFLESVFTSRRHVRMMLLRSFPVGLLYLFKVSGSVYFQDMIEILGHTLISRTHEGQPAGCPPSQPAITLIFCGFAFSTLGKTSRRTPFSILAVIFD